MRSYKMFLRLEAVEALRAIHSSQKGAIARFIDSLGEDPFQSGDYAESDETQRQIEIKVIGAYAITFWADHPVNEIKVTDIRRADRP